MMQRLWLRGRWGRKAPAAVALLLLGISACTPGEYTIRIRYPDNFRVIKPNVVGTSKGFALLGLIPVVQPTYVEALSELHAKARLEPGSRQMLANVQQERSTLYLVLFSLPKLTVRADVIEVTDEPTEEGQALTQEPAAEIRMEVASPGEALTSPADEQ
jgi:hypothetical protein